MSSKKFVICATGVGTSQEKELSFSVKQLGGTFVKDLLPIVTHLVVQKAGTKKHESAMSHNIPCVTYKWIAESAATGSFLSDLSAYVVPPFLGLVISITGVGVERQELISVIENNGGKYSPELKQGYCTHLIAAEPRGVKYEHAKQWRNVKVASPDWVEACVDRQVWLPEKDFPVLNPVVNTPVIPQQSLAKPAPEPQEDVEPVTPQALLQLRQLVKEDLDAIPDCDVFSNDAYYFNGFNDEDTYILVQLLAIGGGMRYHMLSERVTRVLLGPNATGAIREAIRNHPRGAVAVKLEYFLNELGIILRK